MRKNSNDLERRRIYVRRMIDRLSGEKIEYVVAKIAEKLFLSPSTVWKIYEGREYARKKEEEIRQIKMDFEDDGC